MNLNGLKVKTKPVSEGGDGKTKFIQLPRDFWKPIDGPTCRCKACQYKVFSYWDTLAVGEDSTWLVHMPENHPYGLKVDETGMPSACNIPCLW